MWVAWAAAAIGSAALGAWVGAAKRRGALEGAILGAMLGPLGVLVAALLPPGEPPRGPARRRPIDDLGAIAAIAERFRSALDAADPDWERLPYHRKRRLLRPHEAATRAESGLSASEFADFAAEARRILFGRR